MDVLTTPLLTGTASGAILLLAALGLTLTFGQMGVINMANGEFLMVGAYSAYLTQQVISEVRSHFREQVFETQVPRSIRLAEAPSFGKPALLYDIRSTGAEAYLQLAQELLSQGQMALFAP